MTKVGIKKPATGIVANGRENIVRSEGYRKRMVEIRRAVQKRHDAELAKASWWKKMAIRSKIEGEIRVELEKLAPRHALYLKKTI